MKLKHKSIIQISNKKKNSFNNCFFEIAELSSITIEIVVLIVTSERFSKLLFLLFFENDLFIIVF